MSGCIITGMFLFLFCLYICKPIDDEAERLEKERKRLESNE